VPGGLIAENNYGYTSPLIGGLSTRSADTEPGLVRVSVDYRNSGCHIAWSNKTIRIPSVVSKVSLAPDGTAYVGSWVVSYTSPTRLEPVFVNRGWGFGVLHRSLLG